ncbi:MAG: alpha-2-macroglobulin, partial [Planctomycetota bacterium]
MHNLSKPAVLPLLFAAALGGFLPLARTAAPHNDRQQARKLMDDGNFKEALAKFRDLTLEQAGRSSLETAEDFRHALACLQQLNAVHEIDEYREAVAKRHAQDWIVLGAVAHSYLSVEHNGFLIAGEFRRGPHRGGGKVVHAAERDRVRALQLFWQAYALLKNSPQAQPTPEAGALLTQFAAALLNGGGYRPAWRLQLLTNLDELPDYEEGWRRHYGDMHAAPVDDHGEPIFYARPDAWEDANNDGQRWRWVLALRTQWQPEQKLQELRERAEFLQSQFGVQTMAEYGWWFARQSGEADVAKGTLALHTLGEDETIAKLATGIKRFKLPEEHNYIALHKQIAAEATPGDASWTTAKAALAQEFENRRQYPRAAQLWKDLVAAHPPKTEYRDRLAQVVDNWGRFEPVVMQPAGKGATLEYRFRNGERVEFSARPIKVRELLNDLKAYLKRDPQQLDWRQLNLENLGYRLVVEGQEKYLEPESANWALDLDPPENHFDRRVTVTTPLQKAGAYLVTATMEKGNTHRAVVWLADTAIVKKPLPGKALYYVADATSGKPLPKCTVEFFGWWQESIDQQGGRFRIRTKNFAEATDESGMVHLSADEQNRPYQWLAIAANGEGRLAYLGFSGVWPGEYYDHTYKQVKVFTITDRPVYRPAQEVQFKFWVATAAFDQPEQSDFAGKSFVVEIHDPRGEKVLSQSLVADAHGGLAGSWKIPAGATLGQYQLTVVNHGGGSFRVEEYKKPEFEVTIDAPAEPVKLGDKITAKLSANYYFGAPVAEARVKYKVLRTPHDQPWFPPAPWDWLYGPGYWWFAQDYAWYPGWSRWGCGRPYPAWFWRAPEQPEVVAEREAAIGPDGTLEIEIDTAPAKQFHPDKNHSYQIQAEVTDQSRRTIVAGGQVLVARRPFKVYVWTNSGYYRAGDTMQIDMAARRLDGKPVSGSGVLRLLKIAYEEGKPVENEVARWDVAADADGRAQLQIKASDPGQYRLSYKVTHRSEREGAEPVTIEGGQVVVIRGEGFDGGDFRFNDVEIVADKREYAPGEKAKLQISADRAGAAVLLFVRPANGVYQPPQLLHLKGKSAVVEVEVAQRDMPNFFVEAVTVHGGRLHTAVHEVFVPPASRVFDVEVLPSTEAYLPGQRAKVQLKLTAPDGKPVAGSIVLAVYDKALDYIAGGGNVPDIREFFWKWRRSHDPQAETNLGRVEYPVAKNNEKQMQNLGVFGESVADQSQLWNNGRYFSRAAGSAGGMTRGMALGAPLSMAEGAALPAPAAAAMPADALKDAAGEAAAESATATPAIRQNFADSAKWVASLQANAEGIAEVQFDMPENLTAWSIHAWGMGPGTRVGEGAAEVVTRKNIIVRLQAPRFFV